MAKATRAALVACLIIVYPFLSAYLARHGFAGWILVLFAVMTLWRGMRFGKRRWRLIALVLAISLMISAYFANRYVVWLLPSLVYSWLAAVFGYTLLSPPSLCERLVRLQFPEFKPGIAEYLREVTWVWTWFFAINVPVCALLPFLAGEGIWTLYTGVLVYLLMSLLAVGEWFYRRRRFPDLEAPPVMETFKVFARHGHKAFKDIGS